MDSTYVVIILDDGEVDGVFGPFLSESEAAGWIDANVHPDKEVTISEVTWYE